MTKEYQCCPVCNGTGRSMNFNNPIPTTLDICTVCGGGKIIERPPCQCSEKDAEIERLIEERKSILAAVARGDDLAFNLAFDGELSPKQIMQAEIDRLKVYELKFNSLMAELIDLHNKSKNR